MLGDAGYGASAAFRHGLDERGLAWAVGIPRSQKVYGVDVRPVPPGGRKRRPAPDQEPREAEAVLAGLPWRRVAWRRGTKGPLAARFAATRIRIGDGGTWTDNRHLPGEAAWLMGEWGARAASASTTSSNLTPRPPPSRRAGCADRGTSGSSRNRAPGTSRGAPGSACTGTR